VERLRFGLSRFCFFLNGGQSHDTHRNPDRHAIATLGLLATFPSVGQAQVTFNDTTGDYSDATKWSSNPTVPNGVGVHVRALSASNVNRTVTLDQNVTLGRIDITGSNQNWTWNQPGGPFTVTMDNGVNPAVISAEGRNGIIFNTNIAFNITNGLNITSTNSANETRLIQIGAITGTGPVTLTASNTSSGTNNQAQINITSLNTVGTLLVNGTQIDGNAFASIGTIGSNVTTVTKQGTSQLRLSGANSYTGGTVLDSGEIRFSNNSAFSTGTITINGGRIGSTGTNSISNNITFAGDATFGTSASGTTTTYNGTITLSGGTRTATTTINTIFGGIVAGGANGLTKGGAAVLQLSGASNNTYTGLTTVNAGRLELNKSGTARSISGNLLLSGGEVRWTGASTNQVADTATITVTGGTLALNNNVDLVKNLAFNGGTLTVGTGRLSLGTEQGSGSGLFVNNGGTLSGTGTLGVAVAVNNGGTIAPGASPGTLTVNNAVHTWGGGGNYAWQIVDATGTVGVDWDLINVTGTGTLAVTATVGTPFNIVLETLSSIGPDTPGTAQNWNANANQSWRIASAAGGITGWDVADGVASSLFNINDTNFASAAGGSFFTVTKTGNDVYLNYIIPEPASLALIAAGGLLMLPRRKRAVG
jgi:fibronectin-binding autotransporter adhesin